MTTVSMDATTAAKLSQTSFGWCVCNINRGLAPHRTAAFRWLESHGGRWRTDGRIR